MSLETDIQTAYEEQEAVETTARELEARIRKIDGAARLLPARAYGKPIDRDAISKSLTLRGLIAKKGSPSCCLFGDLNGYPQG